MNGNIKPKIMKNKEYCLNGSTRKYFGINGFSDGLPIFEINMNNPIIKVKTELKKMIKLFFRISDKFFCFLFSVNIKPQIGINEIKIQSKVFISTPKKYPVLFCMNSAKPKTEVGSKMKFSNMNNKIEFEIDI